MASRTVEIVIAARDQFTGTANKVIGSLNRMESAAGRVGKGVGQMGAGFARAGAIIAGAAVTGGVAVAKMAIDFEDAFAGVRKTVDEAELAAAGLTFEDLAKSFRQMATEIPIAATEFARIGEAAGALGVKAQDIDDFTKTVALLGVTTDLTTDAAAESLGKIGTILNLTGEDFENFADILVNLGNKGASTESEIIEVTKRFAAAGRQAGLSVPQIAAFASAIASAGVEPEAAGSSLSRLFGNLTTEVALATEKGQAFAKVVGKDFKDFSTLVKTDTLGAMLLFLDTLKDLDAFSQQKALKAVGITNVRDRNAILLLAGSYEKNLIPALKNAQDAEGALSEEAQKRFDTVKSQLLLLRNNFIEAGITIGEGMLPAIKRAAEALTAFLKLPSTQKDLKTLGEDIGKAIDSVNWAEVLSGARTFVSVLKDALGFAKNIFDVLNALPTEVKAAGLAFIGLNKLSGGLIAQGAGNVLGGVAELGIRSAGSRLPGGLGRLFAQPVYVTNWPVGFGGGGGLPPAAAAGAGAGIAASALVGGTIIAGSAGISLGAILGSEGFARSNQLAAKDLSRAEIEAVKYYQADKQTQQQIFKRLGRIPDEAVFNAAMEKLANAPARGVVGPEVLGPPKPPGMGGKSPTERGETRTAETSAELGAIMERGIAAGFRPTKDAVLATFQRNETHLIAIKAAIGTAAQQTAFAIRDMEPPPAPKPPVVNVTVNASVSPAGVVNKYVTIRRYGPTGGSRERSGPLRY